MEFIKLNIQLFGAFAENTNDELRSTSSPKNKGTLYASLTEIDTTNADKEKNQTRIKCYCKFTQVTGSYTQYSAPYLRLYWFDDNEHTKGIEVAKEQVHTMNYGSVGKTKELSYTITAKHKEDGTLKGYVKAKWEYDGSGTLPCQTGYAITDNTPLTAIPRAKTISALSADIGYDTTITLKQTSASYTTTIEWECGELSDVIEEKTTETTIGWKIPKEIYSQMLPTDKEKNITLKATTFNGDTQVGDTQTTTIKAKVNMEDNRPIAYLDVEDTNPKTLELTNDANKVVLNASNILCNVQGMTKNGATIKSMVINGIQLTDFTYRTPTEGTDEEITEITLDEFTIEKTTTNKFTLVVTDSRDNTNVVSTDNEITLDKIDYIVPTISNSTLFKRNAPTDGKVNLKYEGSFFNGSFQDAVPNNLEMAYAYKEKKDDEFGGWITLTPTIIQGQNSFKGEIQLAEEFDYDKVYTLKVSVKDALTELGVVYYTQDIPRGKPSHWYDEENFYVEGSYYQRNKETGKWFKPIGNLTDLETDDKGSIVSAINETNKKAAKEKATKDYICVRPNTDYAIQTTNAVEIIPLDYQMVKSGEKLIRNTNGTITIGNGVTRIKVSSSITVANLSASGTRHLYYYINETNKRYIQTYVNKDSQNIITIADYYIDVKEGDIFSLRRYGTAGETVEY